jgi:hypothetical protein
LPLKQFAKKAFAFGALLRVNKIPKQSEGAVVDLPPST